MDWPANIGGVPVTKRKTWIMVKRGLVIDPKHREALGIRIWLYLYILDRADWERGAVIEWRDQAEADELDMPLDTLRWQRKKLQETGYISCERAGNKQRVTILKWVNPREYSGKVHNPPHMAVDQARAEPVSGVVKDDDSSPEAGEGVSTRVSTRVLSAKHKSDAHIDELNHLVTDSLKTLAPKNGRPRDELFDAIAETCKVDPATTGSSIAKVRQTLLRAKPPYTPAEVRLFGQWWWGKDGMRKRPPTVWALQEQIGVVRTEEAGKLVPRDPRALPGTTEVWIPPHQRVEAK